MTFASQISRAQHQQQVIFIAAGVVTFFIPVLMALGDFAVWVPALNQVLVLILLILYGLCHMSIRPKLIPEIWLFVIFVIWAGLSGMLVAKDEQAFFLMFGRVARACGMAIAIAGISQMKRSATVNFIAVLVVALGWAAYSWHSGVFAMGFVESRKYEELPWNPNTFGVVMLSGVFALAHLWGMARWRFLRPAIPFLALALAVSLFSSASRKSFFGLLMFGMLWLWFCYLRQRSRNLVAFMLVAAVLAGGYYATEYVIQNSRLGARLGNTGADSGDKKRLNMYAALPAMLEINPLAGVGLGNFGARAHSLTGSYTYSHSDYVEVLATTGIVGGILYFPIYFLWWRRLVRVSEMAPDPEVRYHAQVFKAILLTMVFLALGIPHFMQTEQWYWMAAIIGCSHAWDMSIFARARQQAAFSSWGGPPANRIS